jgi:hypothetical protein
MFVGDRGLCDGITAGITAGFTPASARNVSGANIAVRCCSDFPIDQFTISDISLWFLDNDPNTSCPYAASSIDGECNDGKTYPETKQRCEDVRARLCTREEMEAGCASKTGCEYDLSYVWTSTAP